MLTNGKQFWIFTITSPHTNTYTHIRVYIDQSLVFSKATLKLALVLVKFLIRLKYRSKQNLAFHVHQNIQLLFLKRGAYVQQCIHGRQQARLDVRVKPFLQCRVEVQEDANHMFLKYFLVLGKHFA